MHVNEYIKMSQRLSSSSVGCGVAPTGVVYDGPVHTEQCEKCQKQTPIAE